MYLYSIIVPRGQNCGLRWGQKMKGGDIFVKEVFSTLEDGTTNPLHGRIGIRDSIVKVNGHTLDGLDNLKDIIKLIKFQRIIRLYVLCFGKIVALIIRMYYFKLKVI